MQFFSNFDNSYLERLRAEDPDTQKHFITYFRELMRIKLRSRLSSEHIEDVQQETFTRVFAALRSEEGIREPERLGAFVNSTCNHVLLEFYRRSSRGASLEDENCNDLPHPADNAFDLLVDKQMAEIVRRVLDDLSEKDRRLLREVFLEEKEKDEVCRSFGVDRNYLRVLVHRAKQNFRARYMEIEGGPGLASTE